MTPKYPVNAVSAAYYACGHAVWHSAIVLVVLFLMVLWVPPAVAASDENASPARKVLIDATRAEGHSDEYDEAMSEPRSDALSHDATQAGNASSNAPGRSIPRATPIIIRVTGYGAYDAADRKHGSKRLLAIRASRLDAYRNLAERVYGFSVTGTSTVKDFMLDSDQFATNVDSVVRGARVVSITDNPVTGIETVVELELPGNFQSCLNRVNNFKHRMDCLRPMTTSGLSSPASMALKKAHQPARMRTLYHLN